MNIKTNSHFKQFIRTTVLLLLLAGFQLSAWAYDVTATWDFQKNNPTGIQSLAKIESTTGTVNSNIDGIALTVDATNGKFAPRTDGDCQIIATTIIKIPVKTVKDVITVTNYSTDANQYNITYTIGTASGINAQSYSYTATASDVQVGYATLTVTADGYIRAITVTQKDPNSLYNATVTTVEQLKTAFNDASGTASSPYEIFIKNGTYDLGTDNNTEVKDYTHLMGESRDGVIIKNSPAVEGLGTTATLKTGSHVHIKDLTLKCRAPWSGSAERGVCLWDAGTGNIYENICLDGLQDTYYSNGAAGMTCTFTDCIIRGTVDFICGSGNITFNNCALELYIPHNSSTPVIAAPATYTSENSGYVFNNCTVKAATAGIDCSASSSTTHSTEAVTAGYYLGRAWYAGSGTDRTPRLTFNEVTYDSDLIPNAALWTVMSNNDPTRQVFSVKNTGEEPSMPTSFTDFVIDLLVESPILPNGVTQISYPNNGASYNGAQHGWAWYAIEFAVDGPVDIFVGGCQYNNTNIAYITDANGNKIADLDNNVVGCGGYAYYQYKGDAQTLRLYCGNYCPNIKVQTPEKEDFEVSWDWTNSNKDASLGTTTQSTTRWLISDGIGISMFVDAINGKLDGKGRSNAQFNENTRILVPVYGSDDKVSVVSYPNLIAYSIHGIEYTSEDATDVQVEAADVRQGYIEIKGTGQGFLNKITLKHTKSQPRTFKDFKIDFRTDPPTTVYPAEGLPENVVLDKGTYNGGQHGTMNGKLTFPVDGPVKITIGGCQYTGTNATVQNQNGKVIATLDQKTAGCDGGFGTYDNNVTWTYNSEEAQTLTVNLGQYCPYIEVVACDYIPQATVTYYDTDGTTVVGSEVVNSGSALAYAYGETDVKVSEGYKFRGWFNKASGGKKIAEGTAVNADLNLYAVATEIEIADYGKTFVFALNNFDFGVHDVIRNNGGTQNNGHGYDFKTGNGLDFDVAGNAVITVQLCQYAGEKSNWNVKSEITDGVTITPSQFAARVSTDAEEMQINYKGPANKITLSSTGQSYIHNIKIENLPLDPADMKIEPDKGIITLKQGETYTLTKGTDFSDKFVDNNYTYKSSNAEIATVSEDGTITACRDKYGETTVTVRHENDVTNRLAAAEIQFTVKVISDNGQTNKPIVSVNNDGTVNVANGAETDDVTFRYTTDGTVPTEASTAVTDGTITSGVAQGKVVKIMAFDNSAENTKSPSDVVAAYVNVTGTFTWEWDKTGTLQTVPTIAGNVKDIVDENTKVVIGAKLNYGSMTLPKGGTATSVTPKENAAVVDKHDEESTITFNIIPAAGIAFKPASVQFGAHASTTNSGLMDVYLKSESQSYTLLEAELPSRDDEQIYSARDFKTDFTTVGGAAEEWALKFYIYTLTMKKSWGFWNIVVSGTFSGIEYTGEFHNISVAAEPSAGGIVSHSPAALKAVKGKQIHFSASPNKGYKFVEWRNVENEDDVKKDAVFTITLDSDVSYEAVFEKLPLISFENNVAELTGKVPEPAYINADGTFTIPANTTLYKEGFALVAWTDGTKKYNVGETYKTFTSDVTLSPVMRRCDKDITETSEPVKVCWHFDQKDGAPVISDNFSKTNTFTYTRSVAVADTSKIDIPMVIWGASGGESTSKADNNDARVNFVKDKDGNEARGGQLNNGIALKIPAVYGMKVTLKASKKYDKENPSSINETYFGENSKVNIVFAHEESESLVADSWTDETSDDKYTLSKKYQGNDNFVHILVKHGGTNATYGYFQYLEVEYPVLPDVNVEGTIVSEKITGWEIADNAGFETKTAPASPNTGKRYKTGEEVIIKAQAKYGYYISGFKAGDKQLDMTTDSSAVGGAIKAHATYIVGGETGTVTVEYTRLPMAKVRLETVDKTLGTVDFADVNIYENFYYKGDGFVESYFVAGGKVIGSSDAADDYVLEKWVDLADGSKKAEGASFEISVPEADKVTTYQAYFTLGKIGNVKFDITQAKLKTYKLENFTVDEKSTAPADQNNCRSFYIPKYHGLFKTYDSAGNGRGWTLKYWVASDDTTKIYDIGKNYSFRTQNETITLIPVFEENPGGMQNRLNSPVLTYEFGIGPGIRAQKLDLPKKSDTYLCAPVYTEVAENSVIKGHTRDVALWINTGEKGYVRNSGFEEWAAIGPGTTLTIASCAGTKIEILSYAPISSTTIDGVVPTKCQQIGEHEYIYSYTTQNPSPRIPIVIGDDYGYYKWIKAHTLPANRVNLHTVSANKDQGEITKTEVTTTDKDREYITKLEDGGHSIIQGTRVKISFERKFGYVFDKIVDPDKIVNGEPLAVLKVNDTDGKIEASTTVNMVKPHDAREVMTVSRNANEENGVISWGVDDDDHVFILRQIEPTEEEKRNGKRTRYEVEFEITTHRNLIFYFKEKPTYYVTFNPGKYATGIAPTAKWVEEGDEYTIPQNHTLYYSGYTLKYWEDEEAVKNRYNIGSPYNAPGTNLRLFPVFEKNTFSLFDEEMPDEATARWDFTHSGGAPDINYERSSGILVTQLKKSDTEFIDLRIDLDASDRYDESGNLIKGKFNNMSDADRCQINMYSVMTFPVTKNCDIELEATGTISTTSIAGYVSTNGGYEAGKKVNVTWSGNEGTQTVNFMSDGRYYTYFAVTYRKQVIAKPELSSVSVEGTPLTKEQLNTLKSEMSITLDAYPVKLNPETGKFVEEKMDNIAATANGSGKVIVTQPTISNPKAEIRLLSAGDILLDTYTINFTLKATEPVKEGAQTKPQFLYTEINGVQYRSTDVEVENMPASGYIKVVFDRTMKSLTLPFTNEEHHLNETFTAEQGKELIFYYWNIPNAELIYTLPGTMFVDIYDKSFDGEFKKHFKTRGTTKEIVHKTFDFIVGENGSLDDAINAANANEGTDRYLIFIPDGEYQLTGNESLEGRYNITSDGAWPCDGDGKAVTKDDMANKYKYQNGMTKVTRPKVSIIGQSREGVMVWNRPIVEGIGYTATIHVGGAEDFYAEDFSMENRFPYWSSMGGGSGAGRAVVLWDQGKRTTMKNVSMMSWQDTYYSSNVDTDYRGYFENCQIGGVVDWICGNGNIWFEKCDLVVRDRSGNNLAAPSQDVNQQWGYVFNECNIVPEFPLSQTQNLKDKTWTLARPWANDQKQSPACTFIHTRMGVLPKDHGWGSMGSGALLRFHENHTMDAGGTVLSLGARSLAACAPAAGSDDCVMNDTEASKYTIENVLGGSDSFTPKERTMQIDAQSGDNKLHDVVNSEQWDDQIETDDDRLTWNPHPNALCYFIFKLENGKWNYKTNITETSISLDQLSLGTGTYCVRAANQYGGLGAPTKSVDYQEVKRYSLTIAQLGNLNVDGVPYGWSTICLPYNARVPEGVKVYAATAHNENNEAKDVRDYYMTLTETDYLNKDKGYIVYGPAGDYLFKATSRIGTKPTILRGNSSDYPVSSINNSCYILANKTYGLGFYKFTGTELKPYRAWLPADKVVSDVNIGLSSGAKGIRFVFGDNTDLPTGILNSLYGKPGDGDEDQLYNISGQRVKNPASRGIYIRRGQGKVVMGK